MTTKTKAIAGLGLVAGLGAIVAPLASYADTHSTNLNVTASVAENITITDADNSATGLNFTGTDISAGAVKTGTHTITISTSATKGYTLAMSADNAALRLENTGATGTYDGASGFTGVGAGTVVGAVTTGAYNEATLSSGATFAPSTSIPDTGAWGYRMSGWTADNYVSVPTSSVAIAASSTALASKPTIVTFAAQAGAATPAGNYGAVITYTATTN
ncbi:MAG: hypothetical protein LBM12_02270 [Candidatus Nomurabacteria bacterium]|jgi:hypothetical protein|nr:hypothetical protein [Candidatus Nomurabacteria bacterium]